MSDDIKERLPEKMREQTRYVGLDTAELLTAGSFHIEELEAQTSCADDLIAKLNGRVRELMVEKEALEAQLSEKSLDAWIETINNQNDQNAAMWMDRAKQAEAQLANALATEDAACKLQRGTAARYNAIVDRAERAEAQLAAAREALEAALIFLGDKSFIPDSDTHRCTEICDQIEAALAKAKGGSQPGKPSPTQPTQEEIRRALQKAWDNSRDGFEIDTIIDAILALRQEPATVREEIDANWQAQTGFPSE